MEDSYLPHRKPSKQRLYLGGEMASMDLKRRRAEIDPGYWQPSQESGFQQRRHARPFPAYPADAVNFVLGVAVPARQRTGRRVARNMRGAKLLWEDAVSDVSDDEEAQVAEALFSLANAAAALEQLDQDENATHDSPTAASPPKPLTKPGPQHNTQQQTQRPQKQPPSASPQVEEQQPLPQARKQGPQGIQPKQEPEDANHGTQQQPSPEPVTKQEEREQQQHSMRSHSTQLAPPSPQPPPAAAAAGPRQQQPLTSSGTPTASPTYNSPPPQPQPPADPSSRRIITHGPRGPNPSSTSDKWRPHRSAASPPPAKVSQQIIHRPPAAKVAPRIQVPSQPSAAALAAMSSHSVREEQHRERPVIQEIPMQQQQQQEEEDGGRHLRISEMQRLHPGSMSFPGGKQHVSLPYSQAIASSSAAWPGRPGPAWPHDASAQLRHAAAAGYADFAASSSIAALPIGHLADAPGAKASAPAPPPSKRARVAQSFAAARNSNLHVCIARFIERMEQQKHSSSSSQGTASLQADPAQQHRQGQDPLQAPSRLPPLLAHPPHHPELIKPVTQFMAGLQGMLPRQAVPARLEQGMQQQQQQGGRSSAMSQLHQLAQLQHVRSSPAQAPASMPGVLQPMGLPLHPRPLLQGHALPAHLSAAAAAAVAGRPPGLPLAAHAGGYPQYGLLGPGPGGAAIPLAAALAAQGLHLGAPPAMSPARLGHAGPYLAPGQLAPPGGVPPGFLPPAAQLACSLPMLAGHVAQLGGAEFAPGDMLALAKTLGQLQQGGRRDVALSGQEHLLLAHGRGGEGGRPEGEQVQGGRGRAKVGLQAPYAYEQLGAREVVEHAALAPSVRQ